MAAQWRTERHFPLCWVLKIFYDASNAVNPTTKHREDSSSEQYYCIIIQYIQYYMYIQYVYNTILYVVSYIQYFKKKTLSLFSLNSFFRSFFSLAFSLTFPFSCLMVRGLNVKGAITQKAAFNPSHPDCKSFFSLSTNSGFNIYYILILRPTNESYLKFTSLSRQRTIKAAL